MGKFKSVICLFLIAFSFPIYGADLSFSTEIKSVSDELEVSAVINNFQGASLDLLFIWQPGYNLENIKSLKVYQGEAELAYTITLPGHFTDSMKFHISKLKNNLPVRVTYLLKNSPFWKTDKDENHRLVSIPATYFQVNEISSLSFEFKLPKAWKVHCPSLQILANTCSFEMKDIDMAMGYGAIPVGLWDEFSLRQGNFLYQILYSGKLGFTTDELVNSVKPALKWGGELMGEALLSKNQMVIETYSHDEHNGVGQGHYWGFHSIFKEGMKLKEFEESRDGRETLIHEAFHAYVWNFQGNTSNLWLQEGIPEYLALTAQKEVYHRNWYEYSERLKKLLNKRHYMNHSIKDLSVELADKIGRFDDTYKRWTPTQLSSIYYARVFLMLTLVDLEAKERGLDLTSADVIAQLWKSKGLKGEAVGKSEFLKIFEEVLGKWSSDRIDKYFSLKGDFPRLRALFEEQAGLSFVMGEFVDLGVNLEEVDAGLLFKRSYKLGVDMWEASSIKILENDVILKVNKAKVGTLKDLEVQLQKIEGPDVEIMVLRAGKELSLRAKLYRGEFIESVVAKDK